MTTIDAYLAGLALRRHQLIAAENNLIRLMLLYEGSDVRVCVSPTWHRRYYRRVARGAYECEICAKIRTA